MSDVSVSEVDLVARARAGDVNAYAALVERYQALAVGLAAVVLRGAGDAEDVAQEAFLKAYYALDRFRPGASFRAWLTQIVVNEARNTLSSARRRQDFQTRLGSSPGLLQTARSAEDSAVANEQHVALLAILDRQREDDRAVLVYRYVFDLSEAEMAQALECSPGTVKSRLSRAMARLRADLQSDSRLLAVSPVLALLLRQSMVGPAGLLATGSGRSLAAGVLHRIASGNVPVTGVAARWRPTLQQAVATTAGGIVVAAAAVGLLLSTSERRSPTVVPTAPAPESAAVVPTPSVVTSGGSRNVVVVYGGDLTQAQRQQLSSAFAPVDPVTTDSVSRDELDSALRAAGLPVDGSERAVSSARVTCLGTDAGLSVRTENITEMPAAAYANALVTAGVADADVIVAAPPSTPMSGETALVGVLKAYPLCHPGQPPESARLAAAYAQLHATTDIAQEIGAWDKAAAIVLRSAQVAISTHAADDTAFGSAVDAASAAEGVALTPPSRSEMVALLSQLAGLAPGTYARGYAIQQIGTTQVRVVPLSQTSP